VVQGGGSEDAVVELEAADVKHAEVHQLHGAGEREAGVGGQGEALVERLPGSIADLHVEPHPGVGGHGGETPVEALEDHELHLEDLLLSAGAVSDVGKLLELGRVDLLDLGADEEASDPDQLESVLGDGGGDPEEPVYKVHGEVEGLPVQPVHLAHLDQPVEQDGAHPGLEGAVPVQDGLGVLPLVHPGLLLDHQVPDALPVGPAQLRQGGLAPLSIACRLRDEGSEIAPRVSHSRLFPRECLLPPALLTVWGVGGGGRGGGAQEGGARLGLELARQLEGVPEAQVPRAGGRVSRDDVLRVGTEGGQGNTTRIRAGQLNVGKGNSFQVFTLLQVGINCVEVTIDIGLHGVILVVLPLPAEDGGQGLPRVHVPRSQDVGLASGRHSVMSVCILLDGFLFVGRFLLFH